MHCTNWKEIILSTMAGLSLLTTPVMGQMSNVPEDVSVRADNRGPGSIHSGHEEGDQKGRHGRDAVVVAQAGDDVRQEDRRADRREDRRVDRREDRREDRRFERREDRHMDRREDHRSNAGGDLRGLDRADQVAGEHGREGRENARMMHERLNRPERNERMERPDRPDRPDRPERPERPDRPERSGRN